MNDWYEQAVTGGIQGEWIDVADSDKRLLALNEINKRIKQLDPESGQVMPTLVIFSPPLRIGGLHRQANALPKFAFIYLAPLLEYESNDNCTFIVAHEVAHAVLAAKKLRTHGPRTAQEVAEDEAAADELVIEKWKFLKPAPDDFLKVLGRAVAQG